VEYLSTSVKLTLAEALQPLLEFRDIVRVAGENPSGELQGSPILLDVKAKSRRIVVEFRALTLIQEGAQSVDEGVEAALGVLGQLNEASGIPRMLSVRCEAIFIEPHPLPFHELVAVMKDRYLRAGPIVDPATDIGLVFDQHDNDVVKHIQTGPMEAAQLRRDYLIWPKDKIPDRFFFARLGYQHNGEVSFDEKWLGEFLHTAAQWQVEQAKRAFDLLKPGEG
jgi:hypothetical protein